MAGNNVSLQEDEDYSPEDGRKKKKGKKRKARGEDKKGRKKKKKRKNESEEVSRPVIIFKLAKYCYYIWQPSMPAIISRVQI